jgi:hypothetical protein
MMEIIPLIHMKNKKPLLKNKGGKASIDETLRKLNKDSNIYFLDIDGLEKNKPNFCTYQRLSGHHNMWIDAGPRVLGDVVDAVMAGATSITVRQNLWPKLDIEKIKEFTENEIYAGVDFKTQIKYKIDMGLPDGIDGIVLLNEREEIEKDFKIAESVKNLVSKSMQYKLYVYESNPENSYYWEKRGAVGLLVDINKIEGFKNHGF